MARILLLITALAVCNGYLQYPDNENDLQELYRIWKGEYEKIYDGHEDKKSYRTFKENIHHINQLNKLYDGRTGFELNQFADMTPSEFQQRVLMSKRTAPVFTRDRYAEFDQTNPLPESFDWRDKKMVTGVKDQGSVGTCWAFSTVGNIEGQWAMQGHPLSNFSVEQVVDCDGTEDVPDQKADCGVFGGWPFLAYQYIERQGGLESWDDYGYCSGNGKCFVCPAKGYNKTLCGPPVPYCLKNESCEAKIDLSKFVPGLKVTGWNAISKNETAIAYGLMKTGPLSVALNAEKLQFYKFGIFEPHFCDPSLLDHAVLLVGFGTEKTLFGTKDFWWVKNSWGAKWGYHGYFKIKRGAGMCGINTQVTSAVLMK
ncbi:hypothetical protein LOTGIDRAFT_159961 [Lottia gigantea]|uniref:Uncharacterized protein n=1 Tax=Lottia gigantea TaxID=225164 RepID=V4AP27_LOTGI|nr:hypothetical protein LOTGIDRAFT_159961 [Lottia gigantea]ESO96545.1 hypothetical protein LOTGIDRAFT_159961 [Lottia gigantea]